MCGIVAYVGSRPAYPIVIDGLKRLEYRGYDSAGIATIEFDGSLLLKKKKGKVADLISYVGNSEPQGTIGIGHTRWATTDHQTTSTPTLTEDPLTGLPSFTMALSRTFLLFAKHLLVVATTFSQKPTPKFWPTSLKRLCLVLH